MMQLRLLLPFLLSTSVAAVTITHRLLSEEEVARYLQQRDALPQASGARSRQDPQNVVDRVQEALGTHRFLTDAEETWKVSSLARDPSSGTSKLKGTAANKAARGEEHVAYIVLEDCTTCPAPIASGSLVVLEMHERPRQLFPAQLKLLGPISVMTRQQQQQQQQQRRRALKETQKKDPDDKRDPKNDATVAPVSVPPTISPSAAPSGPPSPAPVAEIIPYFGPCVCDYDDLTGCWVCTGSEDDEDCVGMCP